MFKPFAVVAVALLAAGADDPKKADAQAEFDKLAGTWVVTAVEENGQKLPADQVKDLRLVFSGKEFSAADGDVVVMKGTVAIDPGKKPKALDLESKFGRYKNQTALAIYELDGDALKICLVPPKDKRPEKMESTLDNGAMLLVCKRDKP